jgi:hypothetical protein
MSHLRSRGTSTPGFTVTVTLNHYWQVTYVLSLRSTSVTYLAIARLVEKSPILNMHKLAAELAEMGMFKLSANSLKEMTGIAHPGPAVRFIYRIHGPTGTIL